MYIEREGNPMESKDSTSSHSHSGGKGEEGRDSTIHRYAGGGYNNGVRVSDLTSIEHTHTEIDSTSVAIVKSDVGSNLDGSQKFGLELKAPPSPVPSGAAASKIGDKIYLHTGNHGSINSPATAETATPLTRTDEEEKNLSIQRHLANQKEWVEKLRETKEKIGMSGLVKLLNGSDCPGNYNTPARQRLCANLVRMLLNDPSTTAPQETTVSVYRINDLSHPRIRHMVHFNAVDYQLAGCAVITAGISVVVVGGEEKSIERYGKFMLRGIKWAVAPVLKSEAQDEDEDGDKNKKKRKKQVNKCVLLWQGIVAKLSFNRFTVHMCKTRADARKVFLDAGVADYWDLALNYSSSEEE